MRTLVDTSSLVVLARYYHPFDSTEALDSHLQSELDKGSFIVLDKVLAETKNVSQGLAYNTFQSLHNKKSVRSTANLIPATKFYNLLDNNFVDRSIKKMKFSDDEAGYQNARDIFLNSADCALIVFAMNETSDLDPIQVLTEETPNQNDGKLFKKIPQICAQLNIPTINAVEYLKQIENLQVEVKPK